MHPFNDFVYFMAWRILLLTCGTTYAPCHSTPGWAVAASLLNYRRQADLDAVNIDKSTCRTRPK